VEHLLEFGEQPVDAVHIRLVDHEHVADL